MDDILLKVVEVIFSIGHKLSGYGIHVSVIIAFLKYGPDILNKWFKVPIEFLNMLIKIEEYWKKQKGYNSTETKNDNNIENEKN